MLWASGLLGARGALNASLSTTPHDVEITKIQCREILRLKQLYCKVDGLAARLQKGNATWGLMPKPTLRHANGGVPRLLT